MDLSGGNVVVLVEGNGRSMGYLISAPKRRQRVFAAEIFSTRGEHALCEITIGHG
jgi:hypothetical protein